MKACRNPKCFYHVDIVVVTERIKDRDVAVARCTEGFQNRLKFLPNVVGFCPVCSEAIAIAVKEDFFPKQLPPN